jgi:hypothetical protein
MAKKGSGQADRTTALTTAAALLDAELRRYADLSAEALNVPLTSEKNVGRAEKTVLEAAECEKRVMEQVQALVQAVMSARELQEATSASLSQRAAVITQKRAELDVLLARFNKLGEAAKTLNEMVQKVAAYKPSPYPADGDDGPSQVREALGQIDIGMAACAEHAEELARDAVAGEMTDLGRQADGLRQQILHAKNRLSHLNKSLAN